MNQKAEGIALVYQLERAKLKKPVMQRGSQRNFCRLPEQYIHVSDGPDVVNRSRLEIYLYSFADDLSRGEIPA